MMKAMKFVALLTTVVSLFAVNAFAAPASTDGVVADTPKAQAAQTSAPKPPEKPLGITYGLNERFRTNASNNADGISAKNDETRSVQFRTQIYVNVPLGRNVDWFVQEGVEATKRLYNASAPATKVPATQGEIWVDQAYFNFKKLPIAGLTLKAGRQNMQYGDGFVIGDGTAANGGRDYFFNAFILGYKLPNTKQTVDLVGIWNPPYEQFFPLINGLTGTVPVHSTLNDLNQQALMAYYKNRTQKNVDIDGYLGFFKEYDYWSALSAKSRTNYLWKPDRHLWFFGGRAVWHIQKDFVLNEEAAYQAGVQDSMKDAAGLSVPSVDVRAWASYGHFTKYFLNTKFKPYVRAKWWLASGGDPNNTKTDGNWDPLFGRYNMSPGSGPGENGYSNPVYTNLLTNVQQKEFTTTPFYPSNMKAIGAESGLTIIPGLQFIAGYLYYGAFDRFSVNPALRSYVPISSAALARFSTGTTRFHQLTAQLKWSNKKGFGNVMTLDEGFFGDFYAKTYRSGAFFFRNEFNYRWSGFAPFKKAKAN